MEYYPSSFIPTDPAQLSGFLRNELQKLQEVLSAAQKTVVFLELHAEPTKTYEGMMVLADGANWDPGQGGGYYAFLSGTWVKFAESTGSSGTVTDVSVVTANGVSGTVATSTTTPAITIALGNITPSSVTATGNVTGTNLSGTNTGDQTITLTGDVTGSGTGSFAATIANQSVTYAKVQNVSATARLLGRYSSGAGTIEEITLGSGLALSGTGELSATSGSGTVTSVGLSLPSIFSVSGSPVTTSGTLTASLQNQSANTGFFGPSTGSPDVPTFRSMVTDDLPNNGVSYAKFQQVGANSLVGNATGSSANATDITIGSTLTFSGSSLQTTALSGDISTSANSFVTAIGANKVTDPMIRQSIGLSVIGRSAATTGNVADIAATGASQFFKSNSAGNEILFQALSSSDVTTALGYTPGIGSVTSVQINNANGIVATGGPITSSGSFILSLTDITPTTVNGLTLFSDTSSFTITGGGFPRTLTVIANASIASTNTGDVTLSGENYLSITNQILTANAVNLASSNVTGILPGANGGTGIANTGKTITLGGNLITSGAFSSTFTMTGNTSVTFPTSGTLATTAGTAASITGTANQVLANGTSGSAQTGAVTLTLPQNIGTASVVQHGTLSLGQALGASGDTASHAFHAETAIGGTVASLTAYGGGAPLFRGIRPNGSFASPAATPINSVLVGIEGEGHTGSAFTQPTSRIYMRSAESYSGGTGLGTYMQFYHTPIGSTTPAVYQRATSVGIYIGGDVSPSQPLDIGGLFQVNSSGNVIAGGWTSTTKIAQEYGGTGADLSATGGSGQYLKQVSTGASITVGTIPASDITGQVSLAGGGTSANLTASNGGIVYSTASAFAIGPVGVSGQMLQSAGAAAYSWSTPTYPSASGSAGKILRSDGTNNVYSTATFSDTYAASTLLYSNGANTVIGLATANNGVLSTSSTGVPSITTSLGLGVTAINRLDINGGAAFGAYAGVNTAPSNGMIVSGSSAFGTSSTSLQVEVAGAFSVTGSAKLPTGGGNNIYIAGGFGSPNSGRIYIGDGTGWSMRFAKRSASTDTDLVWFKDDGSIGLGATPGASAILELTSTTQGLRLPNMTTIQKNAISSPAAGLLVFDSTLAKMCVYSGAAWQTVTSI